MDTCVECGKRIASDEEVEREGAYDICTGKREFTTNPFAVEIHEDYTKHWICPGRRSELADDI